MKLHGIPVSVHTRKVQLALRQKKIPHDLNLVVPIMPDTLPTDWKTLSPTGLIPVIEDDTVTLPDSAAILQYLDAKYSTMPVVPRDAAALGKAIWLESYCGTFYRDVIHPLFRQRVILPMNGGAPDAAETERLLGQVAPRYLAFLDGQAGSNWLSGEFGATWLAGDSFSIADIAVASNLIQLCYLDERINETSYPALAGYFRRLLALPVFQEQLAVERPFATEMGLSLSNFPV